MAKQLLDPSLKHAARIMVAECIILLWMAGCDFFFDSLPADADLGQREGVAAVLERGWAALYTPVVWLDRLLAAWLDDPGIVVDRLRLFGLCFVQIIPVLLLVVAGWPRAAVWRDGLVVYAMVWVCLAVAGFIQLRGGITVFDS
ncbi:MAG: hypothetical protein ACO1TE_14120 [Prosthecobacter sp.]